jgi:hypothetical protein
MKDRYYMEQSIEYINGYKIIHNVPELTEEEREIIEKDILQKIYNVLKNK